MAMISFNIKELKLVKFILRMFGKRKAGRLSSGEAVWQSDLESLAQRYGTAAQPRTTYEVVNPNEAVQLRQLCEQAKDVGENSDDNTDRLVVKKVRRTTDTTAVDLKAWWGQAVATWDPIDGKNLDSIEQVRRPRQSKWFDKV